MSSAVVKSEILTKTFVFDWKFKFDENDLNAPRSDSFSLPGPYGDNELRLIANISGNYIWILHNKPLPTEANYKLELLSHKGSNKEIELKKKDKAVKWPPE